MQGKMVGSEVAIKSSINKSPLDSYYEFFIYLFILSFYINPNNVVLAQGI
jgi:hypothetical protein